MHRDACQPGGKLCPSGKLGEMLVRAHVGVLHYVLSFAIIAQNGPCYAVEALVVTAHDDFKHGRLTREHADHDFFVTQGSCEAAAFAGLTIQTSIVWSHDSNKGYRANRSSLKRKK